MKKALRILVLTTLFFVAYSYLSPCKYTVMYAPQEFVGNTFWRICGEDILEIYLPNGFAYDAWWELWGIFKFGSFLKAIIPILVLSLISAAFFNSLAEKYLKRRHH